MATVFREMTWTAPEISEHRVSAPQGLSDRDIAANAYQDETGFSFPAAGSDVDSLTATARIPAPIVTVRPTS